MGMHLSHTGQRMGSRGTRSAAKPMSDINVTPFVDVMLVLLIVFMVTAPLLTVGVPVKLPDAKAPQLTDADNKPLTVSVTKEGRIFIQEEQKKDEVELVEILNHLQAIKQANADSKIYVRGDKDVNYGRVMEVLGVIKMGGYPNATLLTRMPPELQDLGAQAAAARKAQEGSRTAPPEAAQERNRPDRAEPLAPVVPPTTGSNTEPAMRHAPTMPPPPPSD